MGRAVTVCPEWAGGYDIVPDHRQAHVAAEQRSLAHLREALTITPLSRSPATERVPREELELEGLMDVIGAKLQSGVALRWTEARAAEHAVAEIAVDFDGEDPLRLVHRETLDGLRPSLERMVRSLAGHDLAVELVEPSAEDIEGARTLISQAQRLYR